MDDRALRQRLSGIELPVEPSSAFVDQLYGELARRLAHVDAPAVGRLPRVRPQWQRRALLIAATVALLLAMLGTIIGVGALIERIRPPTVLDQIRQAGVVRIAVSPESPQADGGEGGGQGFDIDMANEVGAALGVRSQLIVRPSREIVARGPDDWQLAMAGSRASHDDDRYLATDPYYAWPIYVVTLEQGALDQLAQLTGTRVCAVAGGMGESWLLPANGTSSLRVLEPAPDTEVTVRADEASCLDDVQSGLASAFVTQTLLPVDLVTRRGLAIIGDGPVALEPRSILLERRQVGSDDLRVTLNELIAGMRADGTLADLSRRWFGGEDLTTPPP